MGIGVVAVAGLAVTDLYPDDSDGPLFVGVVAGVALFAVVAVASAIGTRILTALAELASGQTPDEGSSSPS